MVYLNFQMRTTKNCIFIVIFGFLFRWQARKEGDKNQRAGLIPSKLLQERRIIMERQKTNENKGKNLDLVTIESFVSYYLCPQFCSLKHFPES